MIDPKIGFNQEEVEGQLGTQEELIPEGKQLFVLYNLWFGKFDSSPRNKRRADDFVWYLFPKFLHVKSGLLLSRLDNGQEGRWATILKIERVGSPQINTLPFFRNFMEAIGAPKIADPNNPNVIRYWDVEDGKPVFRGHDEEPPGPLGLPLVLNIIHKEVPKLIAKRNPDGSIVKETINGFERTVFVQEYDEDKKLVTVKREFIECTDVPPAFEDVFGSNDLRWPKVYELPEQYKDYRGDYFKFTSQQGGIDVQSLNASVESSDDAGIDW